MSGASGSRQVVVDDAKRGTKITEHLQEGQSEYLEKCCLHHGAENHCEFIGFSIEVYVAERREPEVADWERQQLNDTAKISADLVLDGHIRVVLS